jgi:hypothetical protein
MLRSGDTRARVGVFVEDYALHASREGGQVEDYALHASREVVKLSSGTIAD